VLAEKIFYISINNLYLFLESRPSSAGCLAAKTEGVKEDYYV